ncbi:MAG: helix-turn-helix domain-containing protein [Candidatus Peribacteria bacterium]|nr:helix-turn-helix domain-containing protein [Candidatus Peribacteria bacterium]
MELLQSGKSIAEIAEIRELSHGTIEEHLMKLYALDQLPPSEFMKFVNRDNVEKVKESYPVYAETKRIGEVKRMLEEKNLNDISYFDIKVAISMIEKGEL